MNVLQLNEVRKAQLKRISELRGGRDVIVYASQPEELRVRRVGADMAVVALRTRMTGTLAGTPFLVIARYTRVWAREDGRWRIVGGHVSVAPIQANL